MRIEKYQYIDSLRGIAVLAILLTHCQLYGRNLYSLPFKSLLDHGTLGVQLFFIISAFTLCLSFDKRYRQEKHPLLNFYLRRLFRIVPLFYLAIIYYSLNFTAPSILNLGTIISTLTFTNGFSPYTINALVPGGWTIVVEMGFYLLFPFLFTKIKTLKISLWLSFFSALAYQFLYYLLYQHPLMGSLNLWQNYLYYFLPSQLSIFLIGFVLFRFSKIKFASLKPTLSDRFLGQLFILIIIIQLSFQTILPYHFIFSILFGIGIYLLSIYPTKIFVNKITAFIGKISFSLYITHFAVLKLMGDYHLVDFISQNYLNFAIRFFLLLIISTIISSLTYCIIEKPFINLGQIIISHLESRSLPFMNPKT
jgi:peptidoglycan/LPS O-acetylase OafA/YrhL